MTDIQEDEIKDIMKGEDGGEKKVEVETIASQDDAPAAKSIAQLVSDSIMKKFGRKSLRKKPVVVLVADGTKDIPDNLLQLNNDESDTSNNPMVLTVNNGKPEHVQASLEDYLDSKNISHTSDVEAFIAALAE